MESPMQQSFTILQKIEELKNWHKQQQSKLGIDNLKTKPDNVPMQRVENIEHKHNTVVEGGKSLAPQLNLDEMPIKVATPNFKELIENNISPNDVETEKNIQSGNKKPKFRFLKKGEGIARFRMGPQKVPKYKGRNNRTLNLVSTSTVPDRQHTNSRNDHISKQQNDREEIPTLKTPDLRLDFKNWKEIFSSGQAEEIIEKIMSNNQLELFQPDSSIDSSTASMMEKLITLGKKHLKEREELRVFETMEQHVLESSFCSTSSYVAKLMENAVISTPIKKGMTDNKVTESNTKLNKLPAVTLKSNSMENLQDKFTEKVRPELATWTNTNSGNKLYHQVQDCGKIKDSDESLHVRFAEDVDYKSFIEYSQSINNSKEKDQTNDGGFDESEEWKEDSGEESICCSQCSTTYSSSDEGVSPISPPPKPLQSIQNYNSKLDQQNEVCRNSPVEKLDIADLNTNTTTNIGNKETANNEVDSFQPILAKKIKELEDEIEIFRLENKKLKALRESLEKERKQLQLEKRKILKEVEDEKKESAAKLEEERQKLAKEKLVFEKYSKTLTKTPSKEERREMQALRDQLGEMKEELNKKESRWGAAQARVRNQVKHLEEDNKKLREEVETLRKQAKYLEFLSQKRKGKPLNNTKLIHAIGEYISSIPIEDQELFKSSNNGSYFSSKENPVKVVGMGNKEDAKDIEFVRVIQENGLENKHKKNFREDNSSSAVQLYEKAVSGIKNSIDMKEHISQNVGSTKKSSDLSEEQAVEQEKSPNVFKDKPSSSPKETVKEDGSLEKLYPDGRKEIRYKNGNLKKIDPLSGNEKTIYFNGDVKEIKKDKTVKYYFSESRIWHTTLPDGLELVDFPNGQVEKRHTNGLVEIIYPNDCKKLTYPDGCEEVYYTDGTKLRVEADKRKILLLPNGQKEIHTDECVRREYPDGTVKIVYPDGVTETVYSNGRVRLKDKHGNLVMDSVNTVKRI